MTLKDFLKLRQLNKLSFFKSVTSQYNPSFFLRIFTTRFKICTTWLNWHHLTKCGFLIMFKFKLVSTLTRTATQYALYKENANTKETHALNPIVFWTQYCTALRILVSAFEHYFLAFAGFVNRLILLGRSKTAAELNAGCFVHKILLILQFTRKKDRSSLTHRWCGTWPQSR